MNSTNRSSFFKGVSKYVCLSTNSTPVSLSQHQCSQTTTGGHGKLCIVQLRAKYINTTDHMHTPEYASQRGPNVPKSTVIKYEDEEEGRFLVRNKPCVLGWIDRSYDRYDGLSDIVTPLSTIPRSSFPTHSIPQNRRFRRGGQSRSFILVTFYSSFYCHSCATFCHIREFARLFDLERGN